MTTLSGTSAADTFVIDKRRFGSLTINQFELGKDKIDLSALHVADLATLRPYMAQVGSSVVLTLGYTGGSEQISLIDTNLAKLLAAPSSFIFNTLADPLTVTGSYGKDVLFGGKGADKLSGEDGNDQLNGGAGADQLTGGRGDDLLRGGLGNDVFVYDDRRFGSDTINGFLLGKDALDLSALHVADLATLKPYMAQVGSSVVIKLGYTSGAEQIELLDTNLTKLLASPASFVFNTLADPLTLNGSYGNDVLFGGNGADKLFGNDGNDQLNGGAGADQLTGGRGNDLLRGGLGKDVFFFDDRGFGNDTISGFEIGQDRINLSALHVADLATLKPYMAQVGSSVVITLGFGSNAERIELTDTNLAQLLAAPKVFGFNTLADPLTVNGTYARDVLFGGKGADKLFGDDGKDQLNGGAGNDQLTGGRGDDLLRGGLGADTFYFASADGHDTIADFRAGQGDRIDLATIDPSSDPGDQQLTLLSGNVFTGAGQVLIQKAVDHYTVAVNLDSNVNTSELTIEVYSSKPLVAADFVL